MTTTQRYANRQALADGTITHHVLLEADGHFLFTTTRLGELITSKPVGPVQGGLIDALRSEPALLSVGTGLTCITTDGTIDLHELLGLLVVEQPDAEEPNPDDWVDLGMSLEDVAFASDQIHEMRTNPGYETVGRWLYINGERGFVLRGPNFIGVGIADADHEWAVPSTTRDMLEWGFYGESGGPCTFDGGAELAWCGPDIWVFHRWGDWDPNLLVFRAPEPERLVREVAGSIEHLGWTREYLLSAVGLPGLTDEDREALFSADDVEGPTLSSYLPDEQNQQVIELFCDTYPHFHETVEGLRDPDTDRGRLIYAWVHQIFEGEYQAASWNDVYSAMFGEIELPPNDLKRPTSEERIKAQLEWATVLAENEQPTD